MIKKLSIYLVMSLLILSVYSGCKSKSEKSGSSVQNSVNTQDNNMMDKKSNDQEEKNDDKGTPKITEQEIAEIKEEQKK